MKSLDEEGEQNVIRGAPMETPVNCDEKLVVAPHRKRTFNHKIKPFQKLLKGWRI